MSMSTHAIGIRPADDRYKTMLKIHDSCIEANVPVPKEVSEFFDWQKPEPNGVLVDIEDATSFWGDDYCQGLEIDLSKLPSNVKVVRFYNSW